MSVYILGISAFYHDSAAALICDGDVVAAAQEERFTRRKQDASFPQHAIEYVLAEAGLSLSEVSYVVFYDKPFLKFERLLETYIATAPLGFSSFRKAMPVWLREKLFQKSMLVRRLKEFDGLFSAERLRFAEHHMSHAASAFFPSPYENAAILTLDGVGEWATTTVAMGNSNRIVFKKELRFPHSLGLLYSAFTYYCGFRVNSGEYKLMGLAPYGEPKYVNTILDKIIDLKPDGSFRLDQSYFNYATGLTMTSPKFDALFGQPVRPPESGPPSQFHMDIAASIQFVAEEVVLRMARDIARKYGSRNLCLAGGVALNCVANGKILKEGIFENIWVQPAAGDAGGALGAALALWHNELENPRSIELPDAMSGSYLGPCFSQSTIELELIAAGARFDVLTDDGIIESTAVALAEGEVVGWFQGRMEFGPRALGNRSILGDPRSVDTQKHMNIKIKFRESFRPFAPAVIREKLSDWFDLEADSPYMLLVANVAEQKKHPLSESDKCRVGIDKINATRSEIPAVTHVDYSARIQTVHKETNERFHSLIAEFERITGCPILVNTSFNVRGEPIVCTPSDAFRCFMGTNMDRLVVGNCVMKKPDQDGNLSEQYETKYDLD